MNGQGVSADFGPAEITTGKDMRSQGMRVPEDSLAFRLGREASSGTLSVALEGVPSGQALVIHVHEPNSPWVARLALPRQNFLSGQSLDFDLELGNGRQPLAIGSVQAVLARPGAGPPLAPPRRPPAAGPPPGPPRRCPPRPFRAARPQGAPLAPRNPAPSPGPSLPPSPWPGQPPRPFPASAPSPPAPPRRCGAWCRAAMGGRFQVNAEVLGTNARGQLEPLGYVQSAAVLEAGSGTIGLEIDPGMLRASGLSAPFEVHNLALLDQGRMYLLEQRARALRIER